MMFTLAPSILSADFAKLEEEIKKIEIEGVKYIHIDVMDGRFVPNITIGAPVVKAIKKISKKPLDVHLMIEEPEKYVDDFAKAGASNITIHLEATRHPERLLRHIRSLGISSGISVNPATDLKALPYLYGAFDLILIMTVNPGFGGQKLIPSTLDKARELKKTREEKKLDFVIEMDGGVTADNIHQYVEAGADIVVAGNAIFSEKNPVEAIKKLLKNGSKNE